MLIRKEKHDWIANKLPPRISTVIIDLIESTAATHEEIHKQLDWNHRVCQMQWQMLSVLFFVIRSAEIAPSEDSECTPPFFFKCHNTSKCISHVFVCDGEDDCGDKSDEDPEQCRKELPSTADVCKPHEFQCQDRFDCIPEDDYCDGKKDCIDGSDEVEDCHQNKTCNGYKCTSGQCILQNRVCDGTQDSRDGSDELNCSTTQQLLEIPILQVMRDSKKEDKNPCRLNNGNCSYVCLVTDLNKALCTCPPDLIIDTDEKSCRVKGSCADNYEIKCSKNQSSYNLTTVKMVKTRCNAYYSRASSPSIRIAMANYLLGLIMLLCVS